MSQPLTYPKSDSRFEPCCQTSSWTPPLSSSTFRASPEMVHRQLRNSTSSPVRERVKAPHREGKEEG
eukprot:2302205-Rhodomonas_salina.2